MSERSNADPDANKARPRGERRSEAGARTVRPGGDANASPADLDAPEYYAKDRKPKIGTPDNKA